MTNNKTVSFTVVPRPMQKTITTAKCVVEICEDNCRNRLACNANIPINNRKFIMMPTVSTPTTNTPITSIPTTSMPTTSTPTISTPAMAPKQNLNVSECEQKDAVWEVEQPHRGILKVKAYNTEEVSTQHMPLTYLYHHHM